MLIITQYHPHYQKKISIPPVFSSSFHTLKKAGGRFPPVKNAKIQLLRIAAAAEPGSVVSLPMFSTTLRPKIAACFCSSASRQGR